MFVDQGSEFYNRSFKDCLKMNNIEMYATYNERKSVVASSVKWSSLGQLYIKKKLDLGQLYKKNKLIKKKTDLGQLYIYKKIILLYRHIFKICNYKKGTM